jgi:polar amino acid transport system substrate-binding protein
MTATQPVGAAEPISILYAERPPFNVTLSDGSVGGSVGTPAANALRAAGIAFTWEALPTNRSLFEVQKNRRRVCGLGWYLTEERAQFARFTDPISQDGPLVALVGKSFRDAQPASFNALLSEGQPSFLLKTGALYTSAAVPLIDDTKVRARWTTAAWAEIVQEIAAQHYDVTLLIEEEARYYIESGTYRPGDLSILRFPDLPRGELRRLMCSKLVEEDSIRAINAALKRD